MFSFFFYLHYLVLFGRIIILFSLDNSGEVVEMIGSLVSNQTDISHSEVDTVLNKLEDVVAVSPVSPALGDKIMDIISDLLNSKADLASFTNK